MNSTILVVTPVEKTKQKLEQFLKENGFNFDYSPNGKEAQVKVYKSKYAAVLLDLDTDNYPAIQVLRYIKSHFNTLKVLLILQNKNRLTELSLDPKALQRMGASEIYVEPIPLKILMKALAGNRQAKLINTNAPTTGTESGASVEKQFNIQDTKFCQIPLEEFFSNTYLPCGLYFKQDKNVYLKVFQTSEHFDREKLDRLRSEHKPQAYYILAEDRVLYVTSITSVLDTIIRGQSLSVQKKIILFKSLIEVYAEEIYLGGLRPQLIDEGKKIAQLLSLFTSGEKTLGITLKLMTRLSPSQFSHQFWVTFFTATMARNIPWVSGINLPHAILGAILHDIGLVKMNPKIAQKPHKKMTPAELEEFKKHPIIGRDMLSLIPNVAEPVRQIVAQHHEYADGSGFPQGINESKIYPPAKIIGLANYYVDFFMEQELNPLGGLQALMGVPENIKKFNAEILKTLITSFTK
jgi:HD-GYP domain-containing protein (c-di-GMP phosphodiesterase class II)